MIGGLTRGELLLVVIIFGLIYMAGLLPKIAARLGKGEPAGRERTGTKGE